MTKSNSCGSCQPCNDNYKYEQPVCKPKPAPNCFTKVGSSCTIKYYQGYEEKGCGCPTKYIKNTPALERLPRSYPEEKRLQVVRQTRKLIRDLGENECDCTQATKDVLLNQLYVYSRGRRGKKLVKKDPEDECHCSNCNPFACVPAKPIDHGCGCNNSSKLAKPAKKNCYNNSCNSCNSCNDNTHCNQCPKHCNPIKKREIICKKGGVTCTTAKPPKKTCTPCQKVEPVCSCKKCNC